ncbi:trehalose-phosphatase [Phytoactinopolyspora limicola]|uniref:trehalose-phosphatase n=1 Tax=Phytoactinopolyspora limicola TaxID=2715536 RepID=UPI001A9C5929|nr:trehalose-phosphatase [Phytoactinopolyspora limicola]
MADGDGRIAALRSALEPHLPHTLVALDFDGVLAPIVDRPEDARALPGTARLLARIAERVARVAIVTGRPAADAVRLGELADVPGLVVLGHYGLQRWSSGRLETPDVVRGVTLARPRLAALVERTSGVTLEDKHHSLAVHTRRAVDPQGVLDALHEEVATIAAESGLQLTPGRFVLEVRPAGIDKGVAVRQLVDEVGARAVVYAGDDLGDLPAVDAVRQLATSGVTGVVICSDTNESVPGLRERADVVVPGPAGVRDALDVLVLSEPGGA